ncbi:hypothetical protein PGB90_009053 [Kerria lacca]
MGPLIHENLLPLIAKVSLHHRGPCCGVVSSLFLDWRPLPHAAKTRNLVTSLRTAY